MKKHNYLGRNTGLAFLLAMALALSLAGVKMPARALMPNETVLVFEGETVSVPAPSIPFKATVKIKNKKIAKAKKKKKFVAVTGIKAGKTKMIVKMGKRKEDKVTYIIKVFNKQEVEKKAEEKLNLKAKSLGTVGKYAMTDLNYDGITDMFADGDLYAYDYSTDKVIRRKTGIDATALDRLFMSKKKHMLCMEAATGTAVSLLKPDEEEPDDTDYYSGKFVRLFYEFSEYDYFDGSCDYGILRYDHPEQFVDKKHYTAGTDYYCFYDSTYDQDDYWYEWFTEDEIETHVNQMVPDAEEVSLMVYDNGASDGVSTVN
ncbi:MAG: hypothetical protein J5819_05675 [Eubacterium sp.]|nr:hypothetical protein [Eubacterium sp.]